MRGTTGGKADILPYVEGQGGRLLSTRSHAAALEVAFSLAVQIPSRHRVRLTFIILVTIF
jgi:hypothetical protein